MAADGGTGPETRMPGSALDEYARMTALDGTSAVAEAPPPSAAAGQAASLDPQARTVPSPATAYHLTRDRRDFPALLGEFRRTAVLVPLAPTDDGGEAPLAADFGGIRWIYAFSDEPALARFAIARGEDAREWPYRRVLGARLLDAGVGATGVPCGVALDVGSEGDGVLFPPVAGIVPDAVAVDRRASDGEGRGER